MKKDDLVYLKHIWDAISQIEKYVKGVKYENFIVNHLIQDGVIRQIEIIGEATKRLSKDIRKQYSKIPWKDIAGMRDKLIHDYFGVDVDAVWDTVQKDIPSLKNDVKNIIIFLEKRENLSF